MTTTQNRAESITTRNGIPALRWNCGGWEAAAAFVANAFPEARHEGMGYWRIARTAHIHYGVGYVTYEPMSGKPLPTV